MKTLFFSTLILTALTLCPASRLTAQVIVDFEDVGVSLAPDSSFRGEDGSGGFSSGGVVFNNQFNEDFDFFLDNAYSNQTSWDPDAVFSAGNATVLLQNPDGSANIGIDDSATWGVATATTARYSAPTGFGFQSLNLHNTQSAGDIIVNGDDFNFTTPFDDESVFGVTINELEEAVDENGNPILDEAGNPTFTIVDSTERILLTEAGVPIQGWFEVDLAGTGVAGASLIGFEFFSSDNNNLSDTGANIFTPAFVAVDNIELVAVPEPSSLAILSLGALTALLRRRKS